MNFTQHGSTQAEKRKTRKPIAALAARLLGAAIMTAALAACGASAAEPSIEIKGLLAKIDELRDALKGYTDEQALVADHLKAFDNLDFVAFNKQNYTLFNEIHAPDVVVVWPDGHSTVGIEKHDQDIQALFVYAPDTKVESHSVSFGSGAWTGTIGVLSGTFSQPMAIGNGNFIEPTGKHYSIPMSTLARWKDGRIAEEHLFWDNAEFMRQIGLLK